VYFEDGLLRSYSYRDFSNPSKDRGVKEMKNVLGREIPQSIKGYKTVKPFQGAFAGLGSVKKKAVTLQSAMPGESKVLPSIEEALKKCQIQDGMTISFHHHLRNGDYVLNMVLEEVAKMGIKDITLAASSIF